MTRSRPTLFKHQPTYHTNKMYSEHIPEAVDIFTQSFCDHEPMTHHLGISYAEFKVFARQVIEKAVQDQLSIVMLDGKKVVALAVVEDIAHPFNLSEPISGKFMPIFELISRMNEQYFAGKTFEKNQLAHLFITAVHKNYLGQGLSRKINNAAMDAACVRGFDFMCCDFSNAHNEQGTVKYISNPIRKIGSTQFDEFFIGGFRPFANLIGAANTYIWSLHPNVGLTHIANHGP